MRILIRCGLMLLVLKSGPWLAAQHHTRISSFLEEVSAEVHGAGLLQAPSSFECAASSLYYAVASPEHEQMDALEVLMRAASEERNELLYVNSDPEYAVGYPTKWETALYLAYQIGPSSLPLTRSLYDETEEGTQSARAFKRLLILMGDEETLDSVVGLFDTEHTATGDAAGWLQYVQPGNLSSQHRDEILRILREVVDSNQVGNSDIAHIWTLNLFRKLSTEAQDVSRYSAVMAGLASIEASD